MTRRVVTVLAGAVLILGMTAGSALAAPGNDSSLTPTVIGVLPFTDTVDTTTATADAGDPSELCGSVTNTVWYRLTTGPSGIDHLILDTAGSDYNAVLYVISGSPSGPLVTCGGSVAVALGASTTYYIMIGDATGTGLGGLLQFSATQGLAFPTTVNPVDSVNARTGIVTLRGTYSCNQPSHVVGIEVFLNQAVGRFIINGRGGDFVDADCDPGIAYPWTAEVTGTNGKYAGGKATLRAEIEGYDSTSGWTTILGPVQISLRK